jgi:hypothetical protein
MEDILSKIFCHPSWSLMHVNMYFGYPCIHCLHMPFVYFPQRLLYYLAFILLTVILFTGHDAFLEGSVYSYNIVVRIPANLILTTNDITESIQWGNEFLFKIAIIFSCIISSYAQHIIYHHRIKYYIKTPIGWFYHIIFFFKVGTYMFSYYYHGYSYWKLL